MPVNSRHPDYKAHVSQWEFCRDSVGGQDSIKEKTVTYLPMLSGHHAPNGGYQAYQAYLDRALWFGATDRTLNGYVGAIMRKDPSFVVPSAFDLRMKDITCAGQTAKQFIGTCVKEIITTGRMGILVDMDDDNSIPFFKLYYPENIINWKIEGDKILMICLEESVYEPDPQDEYEVKQVTQVRELILDETGYTTRIWQQAKGAYASIDQWEVVKTIQATKRGKSLPAIPFTFASSDEDAVGCSKPPLMDLVYANINHYQLDADYRHGLHFTALPTPVFTGVSEDREYYLGSETAINMRNENAKAFFLEFQGIGLNAIKDAMEERKQQMAALGAQLLTRAQRGRGVETAEAARIQQSGETSLLSEIVGRVEECFNKSLTIALDWMGEKITDDSGVTLNRDYIDATLTAEEITAMVGAWQTGGLSHQDLFWNLQRGGIIQPNLSYDDYTKRQADERTAGRSPLPPVGGSSPAAGGSSLVPDSAGAATTVAGAVDPLKTTAIIEPTRPNV
jgi:hypothetical protein